MAILSMNPLKKAKFLTSVAQIRQLKTDHGVEVAFVGRSNCGKSSLLNALTEQQKLARVSRTPGRTQMINFFEVADDAQRLVDLPGYGFAKVKSAMTRHWQTLMDHYFADRRSLRGVVLINDIRHPLKEMDKQMLSWCQQTQVPVLLVLSKSDKLSRNQIRQTQQIVETAVESTATVCTASSSKGTGLDVVQLWVCDKLGITLKP